MKRICTLLLLTAAAVACRPDADLSGIGRYTLKDHWQLSRAGGPEHCETSVPATAAGALCAAGYFGDSLLEATNYKNADKSIFDEPWSWIGNRMLSDRSQTRKDKHWMIPLMGDVQNSTSKETENRVVVARGKGWDGGGEGADRCKGYQASFETR